MKSMLWAVLFVIVEIALAEVTVLKVVQTIYDRSPKLRIRGSGFDEAEHNILLELSASGQPSLKIDKDFLITKDDDGIILKLLSARRWVNLDDRTPPVALILSSVKFASNPTKNLLLEPVIVANVVATPTVEENDEVIYTAASNELRINGTGFMGVKKVDLFFSPPLFKEVGYEMVSPFPLVKDQVVLRLRHGYKWREEPGPLSIIGIDTGGGPVKLNGEDGIRIAEVQADLDLHGVTVVTTATEQVIYHDETNIMVTGAGFNPQGNTLRFANGILGKGVNFTTTAITETSVSLRIVPGSLWRKNVENLPGYLTLLAVNAGEGFVAVGPTNAAKGRDIATVFERPDIHSSNTKLYRTHSHELHIKGEGFTKVLSKPQLKFTPALIEDTDYSIEVIDRTELVVTLLNGRNWRADDGPLQISGINTRGDEAGWVTVGGAGGVHVAEIVDDIDADVTGGVEVYQMGVKVYQSALQEEIAITGSGFKAGISFNFEPDLKDGTDFNMEIISKNKITLKLVAGKKWRADAGFVIAKTVNIAGKTYPLAGLDGIRVAVVLTNPTIKAAKDSFHETQSKVIAISGTGFTNVGDSKIIIRPTAPGAYKILNVLEDTIRVQLKQDFDWLPSFLSLTDEAADKKIPLQVTGIDTGAGEVVFDEPITVGFVIKDREGVVCDDSCEFAFDGVCDDGSEGKLDEYYEYYGYYKDDDLGGYYGGEDGTEGPKEEAGGSYAEGDGEGESYDDYYMADDGYKVSACVQGTDCTDCGGVDAIIDYTKVPDAASGIETCTNTCAYARDGVCDDPRGANYCKLGEDCEDCGPVGADNFTRADDDGWWDDDDDYWTFNDGSFLDQNKGLEHNRDRVKVFNKSDNAGPAAMFLVVLEGMVYTVGAIFAAAALYLGMRWYKGQSVPFMSVFNPDSQMHRQDLEMLPTKRMPITPDVIRT
mmetsp:Transcript_16378/g.15700  ORF Transcript_16378/g.15700 Transcript_16378/m.15700 type:complete len:936 (-) Transcript_16378:423-3230(-)|eukprot:CAMPEP_0119034092 /NCGR_PEP_ID=MMETSP1177-20130426/1139_1 /TAXON_ID=2985 /ORGANISM="Ochromonas sp, Strain CCMP1899" /LENGTH=935 /DNA_ID=CAMNT_0006991325 /DNA_START=63 /DNA_END=2870 /DNA_ORIENTATION=-